MSYDISGIWRVAENSEREFARQHIREPASADFLDSSTELFVKFESNGVNTFAGTYCSASGQESATFRQKIEVRVVPPGSEGDRICTICATSKADKLAATGEVWIGFLSTVNEYNSDRSSALLMWGVLYSTNGHVGAWVMRRDDQRSGIGPAIVAGGGSG